MLHAEVPINSRTGGVGRRKLNVGFRPKQLCTVGDYIPLSPVHSASTMSLYPNREAPSFRQLYLQDC